MAIYKLHELYIENPQYGTNKKALESGKYKYIRQGDIKNSLFPTFVNSGPFVNKGDVLISRVGANAGETYIHKNEEKCVYAGYLVRYTFNQEILLNKYFYYWTKTNFYKNQKKSLRTGAAQPQFNPPIVGELKIFLPSIEEQQKIIDIIKQKEALFLNYPDNIRIDTFEHTKKDVQNVIDIIEPIEMLINLIINLRNRLLELIKNLPFTANKEKISFFLDSIKNKPKNIEQISAKVLNSQGLIIELEKPGIYKTNTFFVPAGTFVFCSIRTYLKKWGLVPYDVDCNGTLFQFSIKNNITSLISFLVSNNSWEQFDILSSGTKMPVIRKDVFLNIEVPIKAINIDSIDQLLIQLNRIQIQANSLKKGMIELLIN